MGLNRGKEYQLNSTDNSKVKNIAFFERPSDWNEEIYCYAYSSEDSSINEAPWPGKKMAQSLDKRIYSLLVRVPSPLVIFTDGIRHYPEQIQSGYKLKGSMILHSGKWEVYKKKDMQKFNIATKVTTISDTPMHISLIPEEGNVLFSKNNGQIRLGKRIAGGGEGDVYKTNTQYIAKIYKQGKLTLRKQKKLELMVSKKINCQGICYPVDLLYLNKEFVGYLMPQAKGEVLQTSVFIKPRMMELFPDWKRINLVELAVEVLNKIQYLHDRNIILGDINPMNIHVVSSKEIYFVDTDSYQIEDFPCPVGTVNFTAPELQGKKYENYLRTFGNEYFAIATLLFMIMLPGKTPYAHIGGGSPMENIKQMHFPYPFNEYSEDIPAGLWRFCWSHLPFKLKQAFYQTFMKGEEHSIERERLSVDDWIKLFNEYKYLLEKGKLQDQDDMADSIFPTRLKRKSQYNYAKCRICNEEFPAHKLREGICYGCQNKSYMDKQYKCEKCNGEILFTNYDYYVKKYSAPLKICRKCFEYGKQVHSVRECLDCRKQFEISNHDYEYFMQQQWKLPVRCKSCRAKRKGNR